MVFFAKKFCLDLSCIDVTVAQIRQKKAFVYVKKKSSKALKNKDLGIFFA